jgi:hypothetical protein
MSDLIELIEQKKQTEQAYQNGSEKVRPLCRQLAPVVFDTLAQQIDPDLLYTEERDLVMPKLREVARRGLRNHLVPLKDDCSWVVDILAEELWRIICLRRPRYPGDKRGA